MFSQIKLKLYGAAFALVAWAAAWLYRKGRRDEVDRHVRRRVEAMKEARETRHEAQGSDDQRIVDILIGRVRK